MQLAQEQMKQSGQADRERLLLTCSENLKETKAISAAQSSPDDVRKCPCRVVLLLC